MKVTCSGICSMVLAGIMGTSLLGQEPDSPVQALIDKDTVWTGNVEIKTEARVRKAKLTLEAGARVEFKDGGRIRLESGAVLFAKGTADKPIQFVGDGTGVIAGDDCTVTLERCGFSGVGNDKTQFLSVTPADGGLTLRACSFTDCSGMYVKLKGPFEMTGCDFRRPSKFYPNRFGDIQAYGKGTKVTITDNTFEKLNVTGSGVNADVLIRGNVLLRGGIHSWNAEQTVIEANYIHHPEIKGTVGIGSSRGLIRDNVIRGCGWTTAQIGGDVTGNVIISLPHVEEQKRPGGFDKNCTHEHIMGLLPESKLTRNIFVGASYGAVMGIGHGTCSESVLRNNTFDLRGAGNAFYLNHYPKTDVKGIVIRNNLMLRCNYVYNQEKDKEPVASVDYNLWAVPSNKKRDRFVQLTITDKKPGDDGFGKNDVLLFGDQKERKPDEIVVNPDIQFPFTDEDMLARKRTPAEALKAYREAYALKADSPAINAGDPADKGDSEVKDGRPDIGAVEYGSTRDK